MGVVCLLGLVYCLRWGLLVFCLLGCRFLGFILMFSSKFVISVTFGTWFVGV